MSNQVQINCEHFRQMILNGTPVTGCTNLKITLNSENIGEYCLGDKCTLPIISRQELKQ